MGIYYQPPGPFLGNRQPYEGRKITPIVGTPVDAPPFGPRRPDPVLAYFAQPEVYVRINLPRLPGPQSDSPNFDAKNNPFWDILRAWQPPEQYLPTLRRLGPLDAFRADNPPFTQRDPFLDILRAWQPLDPPPYQQKIVNFQEFRVDDPPFRYVGRDPLSGILVAWQPLPPAPRQLPALRTLSGPSPDNPPFEQLERRIDLSSIWPGWLPYDVMPTQRRPVQVIEGPAVQNPPLIGTIRQAHISSITTAWRPPDPQPYQRVITPFEKFRVDNPPLIGTRPQNILRAVLQAWQPPPPAPRVVNLKYTAGTPPPVAGPLPPDAHLGLPIILGV